MDFSLHGANYEKLYKLFNIEMPDHIIDFSTNTNVLTDEIPNISIRQLCSEYPDDQCVLLRKTLSEHNDIEENQILMTNGSNEAIYMIASYLQKKTVGIIQPVYPEYKRALKAYDVIINDIICLDENEECSENEHVCDWLEHIGIERMRELECIFICNPNNPTGKYINYENMLALVELLRDNQVQLVIDEAYSDFLYDEHQVIDIAKYDNVYILRSLTKTYQLAGVRIGYVMSHEENIQKLMKRQPTWSVNSIAQKLALHYLDNPNLLHETKDFYKKEVGRVLQEVQKMNCKVLKTDVNYFLLKTEDDEKLMKYLLKRGLVVRHTRNHMGLDGRYVRIAVRSYEENNCLLEALKAYETLSG